MGFLDNYLTVNQKVKLIHEKFPKHRLVVEIIEKDLSAGYVLMAAHLYRDASDIHPAYTDFAFGNVSFYPNQMKRWFVEDTATSVIGRVCSTALALDEKPNREQMEQIERSKASEINPSDQGVWASKAAGQEGIPTAGTTIAEIAAQLGNELLPEAPQCPHGHRIFRTGQKNGREWGGWYCVEKSKAAQCPPIWGVKVPATGQWREATKWDS